jgi:hypothetical protein
MCCVMLCLTLSIDQENTYCNILITNMQEEVDSEVASQISQLRMSSALSPGKSPSEAHTALKADSNQEESVGDTQKSPAIMSNISDTHTSSSTVRHTDGTETTDTNQNILSAAETLKSAEKGESESRGLVSDRDSVNLALSLKGCEEAVTGHTDTLSSPLRDTPCCSAHARGVRNTEAASHAPSATNTDTTTNTSADSDADNGSRAEDNDNRAFSSTAAPTNRADVTSPDTATGAEGQYDLTDRVLTALLYVIGALILFIIVRRALLFQLYNGKDDPGQSGGEL